MMAAANSIASTGIVLEPLSKDNYNNWSTLVRNYLVGQGLWDGIVEAGPGPKKPDGDKEDDWRSKNAKALHAIQLACGSENLSNIRTFEDARDAWNHLNISFSEDVSAVPDTDEEQVPESEADTQHVDISTQINKLHSDVNKGYWDLAKSCINRHHDAVILSTTPSMGRTILHVAVASRRESIVKELVYLGNQELLRMQDKRGYTALALAAELTDNKDVAEWMIHRGGKEGKDLLRIKTKDKGEIPILLAAAKGHKQMTRYLFSQTSITDLFENRGRDAAILLTRCITAEMFDIAAALLLQDRGPIELTHETKELRPINALAHMPSAFRSGTQLGWKGFIYECLPFGQSKDAVQTSILRKLGGEKIYEMKRNHLLVLKILERLSRRISEFDEPALRKCSAYDSMLHAAKYGIVEFINSMRQANPDLLWAMDKNKRGIFSHAICYRKEKVFRLIHEIEGQKEKIATHEDVLRNNMLHLVAELGPSSYLSSISNSALQMQRELQWFKAVERIVPSKCKEARNADGRKPHELFTKTHEELMKAGEKWARNTATSFTIVGTLIITIMFAAAFTVPGGNDQNTGIPILLKKPAFTVFIIADAISLVMSSSSVLIFIGILTSRYAEKDFLLSLPLKLLFGLLTLFLSVTFMMVSFVSALFMMLKGYRGVVIAALVVLGVIPVLVLIPTILSLSLEILKSTWTAWRPNFLASKKKKSED